MKDTAEKFSSLWDLLLKEDAPKGDLTSSALILPDLEKSCKILAKEDLSLSGTKVIFDSLSKNFKLHHNLFFKDGDRVYKGQCIALLEGVWKDILLVERSLLNWIGHFSGIATHAWRFQNAIKHTKCKILDTRKTTPFFREFEKQAVKDGGAQNHRSDLSTAMMLKENHLSLYNFNFKKAISDCMKKNPDLHLTVEVSDLHQLKEVLQTKAHRVMLDNFDNEQIQEAVHIIKDLRSGIEIEASGNMTLDRVPSVAELDVDYISVGAITHSAPHADITMLMNF